MTHRPAYEQFVRARTGAERALARHVIERVEAGKPLKNLINRKTGFVKGTDKTLPEVISQAAVKKERKDYARRLVRTGEFA